MEQLDVDPVSDSTLQELEGLVRELAVVLDSIGGDTFQRPRGLPREDGFVVSVLARQDEAERAAPPPAGVEEAHEPGEAGHTSSQGVLRVRP